jgi:hypothetical protein
MSDEISVEFSMVSQAKEQLLELREKRPEVASKVFSNFINPVAAQNPVKDLRGKYKPSWIVPSGTTNAFRLAYAEKYRKYNCHHYHFGHPVYQVGRDPVFPGDESEGIIHTVFNKKEGLESHVLLQVDEAHPHPFSAPVHLAEDANK